MSALPRWRVTESEVMREEEIREWSGIWSGRTWKLEERCLMKLSAFEPKPPKASITKQKSGTRWAAATSANLENLVCWRCLAAASGSRA